MNVWLLSQDFFFSSQLQGEMQRIGLPLRQVSDGDALLEKLSETGSHSITLIDLSMPELDLEIVKQLKARAEPPRAIIAYGPHVAAGKLAAAKDAGCDRVLTRGQAHRELATVIHEYL